MIEPIQSLAFSIQANRGVYAVLLGSGVSKAANILTGWEITQSLIRKLARLSSEDCKPDPESWYQHKFGKEPDYSEMLAQLAKTSTERQQLLRGYLEPNDQDREEGAKTPTAAHRAIANLVAQGFIRVIITTNFDRLMETAITDAWKPPVVLSTPDQMKGAPPLIHTQCCVVKVHGDYLDSRIRNTSAELSKYPFEVVQLLESIFDEFGLVVCGWSAEWDGALADAIFRTRSHRFSTYWASHGTPGDVATRLIRHRRAHVIPIQDANTFFQEVQESVESIEAFSKHHPLSIEAAVARVKRYMSESRFKIQLSDLLDETVDEVVKVTSGKDFPLHGTPEPSTESLIARLRLYDAACEKLVAMAMVGGSWATEDDHYLVWQRALEHLGSPVFRTGRQFVLWEKLRRYPATGRLHFLKRLLCANLSAADGHNTERAAGWMLPASGEYYSDVSRALITELRTSEPTSLSLSRWILDALQPHAIRIFPEGRRYRLNFDKLEIMMALSAYHPENSTASVIANSPNFGLFYSRHSNRDQIISEIERSLSALRDESPYVTCDVFGKTVGDCKKALESFKQFLSKY